MKMFFVIQVICSVVVFNTCLTQAEEMESGVSISLERFTALSRRVDHMERKQASTESNINLLNSYVGSVGALMKRHSKVESALDEMQNELPNVRRDHDNDITDLRSEMQDTRQNLEIAILELRERNHDNDITELRNKMQEMQQNHENIMLELNRQNYDSVISELRNEMQTNKENHERVVLELRRELQEMKQDRDSFRNQIQIIIKDRDELQNETLSLKQDVEEILLKMREDQNCSKFHQLDVDSTKQELMQAIYKCVENVTDFQIKERRMEGTTSVSRATTKAITSATTESTASTTASTTTARTTTASLERRMEGTTSAPRATTKAITSATTESTASTTTSTTTARTTTASLGISGRKFVFAFIKNHPRTPGRYTQCLITSNAAGLLEIKVPYLNMYEERTLFAGENLVNLSHTVQSDSFRIENKGIYIKATTDINVYAMNFKEYTSDGFTVIPVDHLSREYVIVTEEPYSSQSSLNSEVVVAAIENNTVVRFKLNTNGTISYNQQRYDNNRELTISLNQYETFQIEHNHDLTGTIISSSSPVAVVSGNRCGNIFRGSCSHLSEMIPPINALGKKYIIPLFQVSHYTDHYIRVVCTRDATHLNYSINGETRSTNLDKSQSVDKLFKNGEFMFITSSKPVLVSVSSQSSSSYDPFMTLVPAVNQYLSNYTFSVPSAGFTSYGSIIIEASFTFGLCLDGKFLDVSCPMIKAAFSNVQYCLMDIPLTPGYHTLHHNTGETFALFIYGRRRSDGYGFSAGMNFTP